MTERGLVGAAITIMGLWRILNGSVNDLYFVVIKQMGLKTASTLPVAIDLEGLIWTRCWEQSLFWLPLPSSA
jgi:hypothetical protein